MSAPDVTPAVERGAAVLAGIDVAGTRDRWQSRRVLAAALDVEEMAQELHRLFGYDMPWVNLAQTEKAYYRDKAADLRAALLGGDQ